ncbi:MAG: complex I subunit 5 family protein [Candidatus Izemoplasmatales bacterium]
MAILLIVIPLLSAFISILFKKASTILLVISAVTNIALLTFVEFGFVTIGGFDAPWGISLLFDRYAQIGLFLVNILILVITLLNVKNYSKYSSVLLVALAGLNGLLLTNDLFNLFVFLEISGIAAYLITSSNKKHVSTFHYLVLGSIGSSLYLLGLVILYSMFGTLNMIDMINKINLLNGVTSSLVLPFLLMFIGLGVEAKLLPFNSWVKGVLGKSNTLSGPMIASVYAGAIGMVFGRLLHNLFVFEGNLLTVVLVLLVGGTFLAEAMAFSSSKAKEILTFSSVAQASIVVLLFVKGIVIYAVYLIVANAISKLVLFLTVNHAEKEVGSDELDHLQGLFSNNLLVGISFTVASLSVIGLPLFVGFQIKLGFLTELASLQEFAILAVLLVASLIEGIYFVRMLIKLWYKEDKEVNVVFGLDFKVVFVVIALLLLALGTYTAPLKEFNNSIDVISEVID